MKDIWQKQLQELLHCDLKSQFPLARSLKRKLKFFVGPTNSGKTHKAMDLLKKSNSGLYLAPLRLLALEGYENLKTSKIQASLITGEEQIFNEEAAHICSTIEMLDYNLDTDTAVIDEVQMLDDDERGWAWVNAIIGCPAKQIIMTGSVNSLNAVKKIALYLNEDLEIVKFKRKNSLKLLESHTSLKNIEAQTALITFSRKDVFKLKQKLQKHHSVSVIYGNLSPEVRRDEAKRFRDKKSDILISTDAISMGLNLPIKTILFTTHKKFDGNSTRSISVNEIVQIAGRAGRFGHHEEGFLGATSKDTLQYLQKEYKKPIKTIKPPFKVKISSLQLEDLSAHIKTNSLEKILNFFSKNMYFDDLFMASNINSMITAAKILDKKNKLKIKDKYMLSQAPISKNSKIILQAYDTYIAAIIKNKIVRYKPSITLPKKALTQMDLLFVEDEVKKISLYLWLSYKFPKIFIDSQKASIQRFLFNNFIEKSLKTNLKVSLANMNKGLKKSHSHKRKKRF